MVCAMTSPMMNIDIDTVLDVSGPCLYVLMVGYVICK